MLTLEPHLSKHMFFLVEHVQTRIGRYHWNHRPAFTIPDLYFTWFPNGNAPTIRTKKGSCHDMVCPLFRPGASGLSDFELGTKSAREYRYFPNQHPAKFAMPNQPQTPNKLVKFCMWVCFNFPVTRQLCIRQGHLLCSKVKQNTHMTSNNPHLAYLPLFWSPNLSIEKDYFLKHNYEL